MSKNMMSKRREIDNPYEAWEAENIGFEWRVLKKYHNDDTKPNARWLVAVKSPFTHGSWEQGDTYAKDVMDVAVKVK